MILMSKYKGKKNIRDNMVEKQTNSGKALPPPYQAMSKRNQFFSCEVFPYLGNARKKTFFLM